MPNAHGEPTGYAAELMLAVTRTLGWDVEVRYMPWVRVVAESKAGKCDLALTVLRRSDYEQYLLFPKQAILDQANVLVVRRGSGIHYQGDLAEFMRRYSIGLYRDKAVDNNFQKLRSAPWARVELASEPSGNLRKLLARRVDAAIENDLTAIYELRRMGRLSEAEILSPPLNVTPAYIVFPKAGRATGQLAAFDTALVRYKRTPEFHALQKRYLSLTP